MTLIKIGFDRIGSVVLAGTVCGLAVLSGAGVSYAAADASDPGDQPPSIVEDYGYPGAAEIEQKYGIKPISGDGGIVVEDCAKATNPIRVIHRTGEGMATVCFQVLKPAGYLQLEVQNGVSILAGSRDGVTAKVAGQSEPVKALKNKVAPLTDPASGLTQMLVEIRVSAV